MMMISGTARRLAFVAAAIAASGLAMGAANAAGKSAPSVVVPVPGSPPPVPGGAGASGCYRVDQALYGPYHMTFCLYGYSGTYRVTGAGLNCRGSLSVGTAGSVRINLAPSFCGRGMQWTADSMVCITAGPRGIETGPSVVMPAPGGGGGQPVTALHCTYQPAVGGYPAVTISATRTR